MMSIQLNLVYQYRRLVFQRDQGKTLTDDQAKRLKTIKSLFKAASPERGGTETPSFRKLDQMPAILRTSPISQPVRVAALDLAQALCFCSPAIPVRPGSAVELIFDDEATGATYRFKAQVAWTRVDADNEQIIGLELSGTPLLLRKGPPSDKTHSIVEQILAEQAAKS